MAGAVAADAQDFSASYYNPAGLVGASGPEASIGYTYNWNHLAIDGRDTQVADVHGLVGGLIMPGKILGIPFAFGVAVHMPDDGLSRVKALRQEVPRWELYDVRATLLYLAVNLAVRPIPQLEVGGGVTFLAATRGRFAISGQADVLHPYDSKLRHEVDADLTTVRYPQVGLRWLVDGFGAVGLVYRGETKLKLALDAELQGMVNFAGLEVPLLYELESRTISGFLPQQVVLGFSFQRVRNLHVNVDLTWVNWGGYESPTAKTKAHLEAKVPAGLPVDLPDDPKPTKVLPPAFHDRLVPRIGVEYLIDVAGSPKRLPGRDVEVRAVQLPVRAGFAYERSPVPPQTGLTNFVDADRATLTVGTGLWLNAPFTALPGSLRLDVHAALSLLPERVVEKTSPADFVGDYRAGGRMLGAGATLGVVF
jgi:long-chain fatty acid transport protein